MLPLRAKIGQNLSLWVIVSGRSGFGRSGHMPHVPHLAALVVHDSLANLLVIVHNERAMTYDRLVYRFAAEQKRHCVLRPVDPDTPARPVKKTNFRRADGFAAFYMH